MARSVLDNIFAAYKSKTDQQTSYQPSNISSHKYTQDIIATPKMVDLCCSKMHPKFAIAAVDLTEKKKKKTPSKINTKLRAGSSPRTQLCRCSHWSPSRTQVPSRAWAPAGTRTPSRPRAPLAFAETGAMDAIVFDVQRPHEVLA
jgi:hypothetical protein